MYYLTQQKHKTALAKEKKLDEISQYSRNNSTGAQLDKLAESAGGEGTAPPGQSNQTGAGGATDGGQTRGSNPKPVPIQPGMLPSRPEVQVPSSSHGRPGSILRPGGSVSAANDNKGKMINLAMHPQTKKGLDRISYTTNNNPHTVYLSHQQPSHCLFFTPTTFTFSSQRYPRYPQTSSLI